MFIFICVIIIVACILLTLVVLIQNPKGGGIAANFTAPNQIMGAKRSTDVVEKTTWILAIVLIVLSLGSNFFRPSGEDGNGTTPETRLKENIENSVMPSTPIQAPQPVAPQNTEQQPAAQEAQSED